MAWYAGVECRPLLPTLGVVTNTEGFCESRYLSCSSVRSSLPISAYMWNISTRSTKFLVSHHFKWQTSPERGQNSAACFGGGACGSAFSFLNGSGRSTCFDLLSWSGSGYSAGSLTSIGSNVSLRQWNIGESTQLSRGHSLYHCPGTSLQSYVSPSTDENLASLNHCTLHAPDIPHEGYLSTQVVGFCMLVLSPLGITDVCIIHRNLKELFSIV